MLGWLMKMIGGLMLVLGLIVLVAGIVGLFNAQGQAVFGTIALMILLLVPLLGGGIFLWRHSASPGNNTTTNALPIPSPAPSHSPVTLDNFGSFDVRRLTSAGWGFGFFSLMLTAIIAALLMAYFEINLDRPNGRPNKSLGVLMIAPGAAISWGLWKILKLKNVMFYR